MGYVFGNSVWPYLLAWEIEISQELRDGAIRRSMSVSDGVWNGSFMRLGWDARHKTDLARTIIYLTYDVLCECSTAEWCMRLIPPNSLTNSTQFDFLP
jgi:hypothetical protein